MHITAIILAGGKSNRMGTDKSLVEYEGVSLLQRMINIVEPVADSILISSNHPGHQQFGFEVIPDEIKNCGPIGGIYSALKKSETDWNIVTSVDATFVENEFIRYLISETNGYDAIVPFHSKGKEPLIAMYHKNGLLEMENRIRAGTYKMQDLVLALTSKFVDAQIWLEKYPKLFHNINRPEDLINGFKLEV